MIKYDQRLIFYWSLSHKGYHNNDWRFLLFDTLKNQKMKTKSQSRVRENQACLKSKENDNRCYGNFCN